MSQPLKCYVRRVMRHDRYGRPKENWLWFFTDPFVYSVWLKDLKEVTPQQFLQEQMELARQHYRSTTE